MVDWIIRDYEPADEAPKGDPARDCTGEPQPIEDNGVLVEDDGAF